MQGIVVVGHGSRSKEAREVFFQVVEGLRKRAGIDAEGCFMELSEPDIKTVLEGMYKRGIRDIKVLPYFLFEGIHIKEDIPQILKGIKEQYQDIVISMGNPIGYHNFLVDILLERLQGESKCI